MRNGPRTLDIFSGAGLLSHAFMKEGFDIRKAIEAEPVAASTYARNIGPHVHVGDVRKMQPSGRYDVIIAGPPCQGFSTLGNMDMRDPRNYLSLELLRWVAATRPHIVVIENVAPFLRSAVWQRLRKRFNLLDYDVEGVTLNAADFGVPQLRTRSFTFATRRSMPQVPTLKTTQHRTVRQAWGGLTSRPDGANHHELRMPSPLALARIRCIPPGGDKRDIMRRRPRLVPRSWWNIPGDATDVWGRMEWDAPSNTLRTCLFNPSKGRYIHPDQHRMITMREAARLQSVPDSFQFCGLPTQISRQIGNGVPPLLGRAIAKAVLAALN